LSEVEVVNVNVNTFNGIETDAKVRGLTAQAHCLQGLEIDDKLSKQSIGRIGQPYLQTEGGVGVIIGQSGIGFHWGMALEDHYWSYATLPKIRNGGTAQIYGGAIARMGAQKVVRIRDVVGSELCISSNSGKKVFDTLRSTISCGNKVRISFENIKSLSAAFLDSAIGQLYNGEISGNVDEMLSFDDNLPPGRKLIVERAISEAKEYYSDPEGYVAKMKELLADD